MYKYKNQSEIKEVATQLYDEGWRAADKHEIKAKYDIADLEAVMIADVLDDLEELNTGVYKAHGANRP